MISTNNLIIQHFLMIMKKNLYELQENNIWIHNKILENSEYDRYIPELGCKNFVSPRYYKRYRIPKQLFNYFLWNYAKVKNLTLLEREKVLKNLILNYPEKINILSIKELKELYNEKFNSNY